MEACELLISEVQKRSVLWNKFDKKYRDRIVCDKEWSIVAKKTNLDKEDAKKKWRNLRDTFLKEKKKVKKCRSGDSQECAEIYTGKWIYYKLMVFLKDTATPRNTKGNVSDEEDSQQQNSDLSEIEVADENYCGSATDNPGCANTIDLEQSLLRSELENDSFIIPAVIPPSISSGSDVSQSSSTKRKKKQQNKDFESELLKLEEQKLTALLQSSISPTIDDEDMLFLKSLHPYFQSMNPLQKLRLRNQIQTVFINELSTQVQQLPLCNDGTSAQSHDQYSSQQTLYQNISVPNFNIQQQNNQTIIANETYQNSPAPNFNF